MGIGGAVFFSVFCVGMAFVLGMRPSGAPKWIVLVPLGMAAFAIFGAIQSNKLGRRLEQEAAEARRVDREMRAAAPRASGARPAARSTCAYCGRGAGEDGKVCEGCGAPVPRVTDSPGAWGG